MNALVPVSSNPLSYAELERLGSAIAKSGLFGMKTAEQAITLMMIAQAEGRHPALAARDYDVIQGKPAKKSEAMLRDFLEAGGHVTWHALTDEVADATFKHQQGGEVRITWDMQRAQKAGLKGKDLWGKYPRQMLRSRTVSEGVRTVWPMATSGCYVPEEVRDFTGPTIEAKPEPEAPSTREAINASVPIAPKPRTRRSFLDETRQKLEGAQSHEAVNAVLFDQEVVRAREEWQGPLKAELEDTVTKAIATWWPAEPENGADEPVEIFGEENVLAG